MNNSFVGRWLPLALLLIPFRVPAAQEACDANSGGNTSRVIEAITAFKPRLSAPQLALFERPLTRETAIQWSNLPVAITPRAGLRLGDLDAAQAAAAHRVFEAVLSACGVKMFDEIRQADEFLQPLDKDNIGWDSDNYYFSVLGTPATKSAWILQLGGHHIAYNLAFNGKASATPLFFGTEPIRFETGGRSFEPLSVQSTAMSNLARAIQSHPDARLSGTFTDVVKGVQMTRVPGKMPTGGIDSGFPQTWPTGTTDRGVPYSALAPAQQAAVRTALRSYASLPGAAISKPLVAAYESAAALNETYVGYAGAVDLSAKGSYVRIDGPRMWMEFVVQPAVANPQELHYHALWRDKQSDYGGEVH